MSEDVPLWEGESDDGETLVSEDRSVTSEDDNMSSESDHDHAEEHETKAPPGPPISEEDMLAPAVTTVINALGGFEDVEDENGIASTSYQLGDEPVACLKDMKRFLALNESMPDVRPVSRICGRLNFVRDLVEVIKIVSGTSVKGDRMALACIELIMSLTWPVEMPDVYEDKDHDEGAIRARKEVQRETMRIIDDTQKQYKDTLLRLDALVWIVMTLQEPLSKGARSRDELDDAKIGIVLHLLRNLALIKDDDSRKTQNEFVLQLHATHIFDLLVSMTSRIEEFAKFDVLFLDIISLLMRTCWPKNVAITRELRAEKDAQSLQELLAEEKAEKIAERKQNGVPSRHSRFGTTISVPVGDGRKFIVSKVTGNASPILDKKKNARPAKRQRIDDIGGLVAVADSSTYTEKGFDALNGFIKGLLNSSFNAYFEELLKSIRYERGHVNLQVDPQRCAYLMAYLIECFFIIHERNPKEMPFERVAIALDSATVGWVNARLKEAMDDPQLTTVDVHIYAHFFLWELRLIFELSRSRHAQSDTATHAYHEAAKSLQAKIFYDEQTLDDVVKLLQGYQSQKHSLSYLITIISLANMLLKMLERYAKGGKLSVAKRRIGQEQDFDTVERDLKFQSYAKRYATASAIETSLAALNIFNSGSIIVDSDAWEQLTSLLYRQVHMDKLAFLNPWTMELFHRILNHLGMYRVRVEHGVLRKLLLYLVEEFFHMARRDKTFLVRCFFPLHAHEDTPQKPTSAARKKGDIQRDSSGAIISEKQYSFQKRVPEDGKVRLLVRLLLKEEDPLIVKGSDPNRELLLWIVNVLRDKAYAREDRQVDMADRIPDQSHGLFCLLLETLLWRRTQDSASVWSLPDVGIAEYLVFASDIENALGESPYEGRKGDIVRPRKAGKKGKSRDEPVKSPITYKSAALDDLEENNEDRDQQFMELGQRLHDAHHDRSSHVRSLSNLSSLMASP